MMKLKVVALLGLLVVAVGVSGRSINVDASVCTNEKMSVDRAIDPILFEGSIEGRIVKAVELESVGIMGNENRDVEVVECEVDISLEYLDEITPSDEGGIDYILVEMPERDKDFKSYMDYRCLGEYLQKDLQDLAYTDEVGFRRVDDRYIIAVGTAVSDRVGTYVILVLENGIEIECIVGDIKDDKHTEENRIVTEVNQCVSEFIIDKDVMAKKILSKGSVSWAFEDWKSKVEYIKVEDKNYFGE